MYTQTTTKIIETIALGAILISASFFFANTALAGNHKVTPANASGSIGKVTVDADVSEWNVGSGQFNGTFVVAENQGVQLGLRAQERHQGLLNVEGDRGNRVGVYSAETGDTGGNNATWNYDWHVDLSDARGKHAGKSLADYRLELEQDFSEENIFGLGTDPIVLPMVNGGACFDDTFDPNSLCQQSWNPGFGNSDFDPHAEGTYNLRLVLTPETFNANPLAVAIKVEVQDAE